MPYFIKIPALDANSADPDQTPCSSASDLGLHCLPMGYARHKRVKHFWDTKYK